MTRPTWSRVVGWLRPRAYRFLREAWPSVVEPDAAGLLRGRCPHCGLTESLHWNFRAPAGRRYAGCLHARQSLRSAQRRHPVLALVLTHETAGERPVA